MNQPQVIAVSGQPKLAEKMAQFDAKKYAEVSGKGDSSAKKEGKKEKKEQPKKEQPKKEQPKNEAESVPWFWEHFDHDNYSIWFCEYLYPEELKMTFMSSNLVGGMMQRLDKLRKYAFGSMAVFGSNNDSSISGVWVWRGQDLAFEKSEDLQIDYSSYKWTKFDSKSEECKAKVDQYFKWLGTDSKGRPFCDGKIFK